MVTGRVVSLVGAGILALSATPAVADGDPGRWMRTGDVWRFRLAETCGHVGCSAPDGMDGQGWRCPVQTSPAEAGQTMVGPGLFVEAPATMRLSLNMVELAHRVAVVCARLSSMPPGKLGALAATGELADGVTQSAETASVAEAEARALAGQFAEDAAALAQPPTRVTGAQPHVMDGQAGPQTYTAESQAQYPIQEIVGQAQPPMQVAEDRAQRPAHVTGGQVRRPVYVEGRSRPPRQMAEGHVQRPVHRGEGRSRPPMYMAGGHAQSPIQMVEGPIQSWGQGAEAPGHPRNRGAEEQNGPHILGPEGPDRSRGHNRVEPVAEPQAMPQFPMSEMPANTLVNPGQSPLVDGAGPQAPLPGGPQPGQELQVPPGQMAIGDAGGPAGGPPPMAQGVPAEVPQPAPNAAPAPAPVEMMQEPLSGALSNLPPLPQLPPGQPLPPGMIEGGTPPELLMPMAAPTPSGPPLTRSLNNTQAIAQEDSGLELIKGWPGVVAAIAALIAVLALQMRLGRRKVVSDPQPK
ncbi:hypothetical protein [Herbidospora mongoliensis]|uniref:hypothetical protein n=1 Tax=Herbidospora mongoliensis TaxID=688067 RepID=UPI000AFFC915|nr:hypothetical protein [Herbidospora mongoliensis]